jgi:hypothetical protein
VSRYRLNDEECPACGLAYGAFRTSEVAEPLTFADAKASALADARARASSGDYSSPARRARVLGMMHQAKQEAWREHVRLCEALSEAM